MPDMTTEEPPRAEIEPERPRRYWGLRPRRSIRRWSLVAVAVGLLGVIAAEVVWLLRHRP